MNSEQDKIIARIRKMLALSADEAASEGERDNALRMAHATLAKYNLNLGEAEAETEKRIESCAEISPHARARLVSLAIANLYFCEYFFVRRKDTQSIRHYFIGRESNVATAKETASFVVKSIARQARKETSSVCQAGKYERDFCKGAASAIYSRCKEIREAAETADTAPSGGTSLVLASLYKTEQTENSLAVASLYKPTQFKPAADRQSAAGSTAFYSGKKFGGEINLNKQLGATK